MLWLRVCGSWSPRLSSLLAGAKVQMKISVILMTGRSWVDVLLATAVVSQSLWPVIDYDPQTNI